MTSLAQAVVVASYGTCPVCRRVLAVTRAGFLRKHTRDHRLTPHTVAVVACEGASRRHVEYDDDVRDLGIDVEADQPDAENADQVVDLDRIDEPENAEVPS